jgi:hypothetical protein
MTTDLNPTNVGLTCFPILAWVFMVHENNWNYYEMTKLNSEKNALISEKSK